MSNVKKEIVVLSAVALGAMAAGFFVVLLILGPGRGDSLPDPFEQGSSGELSQASVGEQAPAEIDGHKTGGAGEALPDAGASATGPEEQPLAQVLPSVSATPAHTVTPVKATGQLGLTVGEPFVWRCWPDGSESHLEKEACGSLDGTRPVIEDNLGIIEKCVIDFAGKQAKGKLSLALRLDFEDSTVKAWLGNSTTVDKLEDISACLRNGFGAVPVPDIAHVHPRYIIFFNVEVG